MVLFFLSSGLFLGWSLGANDAANIFGTAVGSRMIKFKTAAIICGVFVIFGSVISGSGTSATLQELGTTHAIAGSFMIALASALTVFWMSKSKLPVSTSQAIVGAIVGWNIFAGHATNYNSLFSICLSWIASPLLAALLAIPLYGIIKLFIIRSNIHLLRIDTYIRAALIIACALGAYSLGANNIANVVGIYVPVVSLPDINFFNLFSFTNSHQLFFLGGLMIAIGVFTYSRKVVDTIGSSLFRLSPEAALVAVLAQALVLFLFSSVCLKNWLISVGLPPIPLVPVSSTQAIVGAVIGIGILKGARGIRYNVLGEIALGWLATPVISGLIAFFALFFLQNVFNLQVQ
jgi:PiT family inorganic phosphate transporter